MVAITRTQRNKSKAIHQSMILIMQRSLIAVSSFSITQELN